MKFPAFLLACSFMTSLAGAGVRQDWVRHLGLAGGPALLTSMAAIDSGLVAVCGSAWNRATSDDLQRRFRLIDVPVHELENGPRSGG